MSRINLKLEILPGGLFQLIRKKAHEQKKLKLHFYLEDKIWRVNSEWTPFDSLECENLESLLIAIAALLSEGGKLQLDNIAEHLKALTSDDHAP